MGVVLPAMGLGKRNNISMPQEALKKWYGKTLLICYRPIQNTAEFEACAIPYPLQYDSLLQYSSVMILSNS